VNRSKKGPDVDRTLVARLLRELAAAVEADDPRPKPKKRTRRLPVVPHVEVDPVTEARVKQIMREKGYVINE
jgi:hypothetical protein